jgi:hypothetical protein
MLKQHGSPLPHKALNMQETEHVVQSLEADAIGRSVTGVGNPRRMIEPIRPALRSAATAAVGHVWRKVGVIRGRRAVAGFVPGGWADINKMAHRMTGWEGIRGANGVNGDKGEMLAQLGRCQQVGRRSCRRIARILDRALKSLERVVAIRVEGTPGVAALRCRHEQAVGKLATNEDHRNSPLKSLNNRIQYLDS